MARQPDTTAPRDQYVRTRITKAEKERYAKVRGRLSESDWVRQLMEKAAQEAGQ